MDANAQYELYLIKKELQDIIDELNSISAGVKRDFCGIGNDKCAASISASAQHYRDVKAQLEKMDLSALSDEFIAKEQEERKAATAQKTPPSDSNAPGSSQSSTSSTSKMTMATIVENGLESLGEALSGVFSWFK